MGGYFKTRSLVLGSVLLLAGGLLVLLNSGNVAGKLIGLHTNIISSKGQMFGSGFHQSPGPEQLRTLLGTTASKIGSLKFIELSGHLLIKGGKRYRFRLNASRGSHVRIDGKILTGDRRSSHPKAGIVELDLDRGLHSIEFHLNYVKHGFFFHFHHSVQGALEWEEISKTVLFSPEATAESYESLQKRSSDYTRRISLFYLGLIMIFLSGPFFLIPALRIIIPDKPLKEREKDRPSLPAENEQSLNVEGRYGEIDITKGIACFLMIVAHIDGSRFFHFGTFGAALFFFCSGMNTLIFSERNIHRKNYISYHLFFLILLFFGGYSQIVIAHGDHMGLIPEFLQVSALSVFVIALVKKIRNKLIHPGYLFPLPFIIYLVDSGFLNNSGLTDRNWTSFILGKGFSLFPWLGFFLLGAFLFRFRQHKKVLNISVIVSGSLFFIFRYAFGIPIRKFDMSISYMFAAMCILIIVFILCSHLIASGRIPQKSIAQNGFAVAGRNSLLFVFLHYFGIYYLKPKSLDTFYHANLLFQSVVIFVLITLMIRGYEIIKYNSTIIFSVASMAIILLVIRLAGLFYLKSDLRLLDMFTGTAFAILYVYLRKRMRGILKDKSIMT